MSFKRFRDQDLIQTTIKTHPEYNFIVNKGETFFQREKVQKGDISDEPLRHTPSGNISLYELNIDRPSTGEPNHPHHKISATMPIRDGMGHELTLRRLSYNERASVDPESELSIPYPLSASLGRIYVEQDTVTRDVHGDHDAATGKHILISAPSENRKYVIALENLINFPDGLQSGNFENDYKLEKVNMICIPGIFYGSTVKKGSIKLNYYVKGKSIATAEDKEGKIICTYGPAALIDRKIGDVIYNQGLILLNNGVSLDDSHEDKYFAAGTDSKPSWLNFGTGIKGIGKELTTGTCDTSAYSITFKGTNKIPTLSMFSFSEIGEHNYSNNPTFLNSKIENESSLLGEYLLTNSSFEESEKNIKSINKSPYPDHDEEHISTTYISKVGIYDEDRNLIAIATLANPAKKTEKRDFMIKMKIDF